MPPALPLAWQASLSLPLAGLLLKVEAPQEHLEALRSRLEVLPKLVQLLVHLLQLVLLAMTPVAVGLEVGLPCHRLKLQGGLEPLVEGTTLQAAERLGRQEAVDAVRRDPMLVVELDRSHQAEDIHILGARLEVPRSLAVAVAQRPRMVVVAQGHLTSFVLQELPVPAASSWDPQPLCRHHPLVLAAFGRPSRGSF